MEAGIWRHMGADGCATDAYERTADAYGCILMYMNAYGKTKTILLAKNTFFRQSIQLAANQIPYLIYIYIYNTTSVTFHIK